MRHAVVFWFQWLYPSQTTMSHKDELLYINIPLSGIVGHVCGLKWRTWQSKMYFIFQMYLSIQYFISHLTPKHIFTIIKIIVFCMTFRLPHEQCPKILPLVWNQFFNFIWLVLCRYTSYLSLLYAESAPIYLKGIFRSFGKNSGSL